MGYTGITGGLQQIGQSATLGQRIQTATQLVFGLLGVAAVAMLVVRRRWARLMLVAWGAAISISGGMAAVVWGGQGPLPAAAATFASALIAWLTQWAVRPAMPPAPA
jgi:hypothetical protein